MATISLVTISFNQKEFLKHCLRSVFDQNINDLQYIVVDPGSTDGSREVISQYPSITKVFEKDSGPADGLNRGFSRAHGEILGYLNSDDILLPGALEMVRDLFTRNPDIDVIYGHGLIIDADGNVLRKCFSDQFFLRAAAYGTTMVVQPSTFFRRSIFEKAGGFNVENKSNWDHEIFVDFVLAGAMMLRADCFLSGYRVHGESITGSGKLAALHGDYRQYIFRKIMGRPWGAIDPAIAILMRIKKHLFHPRSAIERLLRGGIFRTHQL